MLNLCRYLCNYLCRYFFVYEERSLEEIQIKSYKCIYVLIVLYLLIYGSVCEFIMLSSYKNVSVVVGIGDICELNI